MKAVLAVLFVLSFTVYGQDFLNGDALPDAPALAARGSHQVGVQTFTWTNKAQIDVINSKKGIDPLYDRKITVEAWYPAALKPGEAEQIKYDEVMGTANDPKRPLIPFTFGGRACRNASPLKSAGKFPLIIISHGYVGSRFLMTYLTENLASKGYVVVAIDHTESTFRDAAAFSSTLLNRAKDDLFVISEISKATDPVFAEITDKENIGLIGYSMGGYGVLNVAGAAYATGAINTFKAFTGGSTAIKERTLENPNYSASIDPRIKAVVAFAPWGMERAMWDSTSLQGLRTPTFFVAGSEDDISGYKKGIKAIFDKATRADRYLLTYQNARHNIAPNPPPAESLAKGLHFDEYYRYAEPAWNEKRINNINQHFLTAFLGIHLKKEDHKKYLDFQSSVKTWPGFKERSSVGLSLEHLNAQ